MGDDALSAGNAGGATPPLRALAVFHGRGDGFWPWLAGRPGFRHCFVALNDGRAWIVVDPCSDGIRLQADLPAEVDLAAHYRELGYAVVQTSLSETDRRYRAPWAFTCVEAAAHYAAEGQAQLQALFEAGALTGEQLAARSRTFRRDLYAAVIRGQPASQAMAELEDRVYDKALGDTELKRFLMQEAAWRAQSEAAQGAAMVEAQLDRLRRGEPVPDTLSSATRRILTAGDLADAELQSEIALRARAELQGLRFAPEAEIEERRVALAPQTDLPDAAARSGLQREIAVQGLALLRERRVDPAAYVMAQPAVAAIFAAAEKTPGLLSDAVAARLAAQEAMGLGPEERNALTGAERSRIVAGLQRLAPRERIVSLMGLGGAYGAQSGAVAGDLVDAGLSVAELLAADPSADPAIASKLAAVLEDPDNGSSAVSGLIGEAVERLIADAQAADRRGAGAGI